MSALTINQLITQTRRLMDAVGSDRWSDEEIADTLSYVYDAEWSRVLQAAPYYRFQSVAITTAADGTFPLASLSTGSGNAEKNFYRILSVNDGNTEYGETRYQDVPLATTSAYLPYLRKLYYLAGDNYQVLPTGAVTLNVVVNYKPTSLRDYVDVGATDKWDIPVDWEPNDEMLLVYEAAARSLMKGGEAMATANSFLQMANSERADFLDNIRRRTINPTRMAYSDMASDWSG